MSDGNLWRAFLRVTQVNRGNPAFVGADQSLGYRQLADAAATLADELSSRGVGAGDLVAIELPIGPHFIISMLAALAVGAAYLPLDVSGPPKRHAQILEDATPAVVLRPGDEAIRVAADSLKPMDSLGPERHQPTVSEDDPAYVIYTSGSTGRPKGVVVPARGIHNLIAAFQCRAPLSPGARQSLWTSPGFDVSIYEIWGALLVGGTVVHVPETHRRDVSATLDFLAEQRIESAYLPPQFLPALRDRVMNGNGPVPPLRRLLTGVEPIPVGVLVDLRVGLPGAVVINGYGPTEATVTTTLYTVPDRCEDPQSRAPIGTVIEGNRGFILDERLAPVGLGQPGELCVAGRGLALGYLNDPSRTAERFVPSPDGRGLMYRTGDLVVADAEGELTFLGRIDDQVKVDGVRIEPAETEAALRRLGEISDVAVLARPATADGPLVLTAFVVFKVPVRKPSDDVWADMRARNHGHVRARSS